MTTTNPSYICKGCWQQMRMPIPIRGVLSVPLRIFGIGISRMNPNLCTICETMFTRVKRRKQIVVEATVLFADLRGYTALSEAAPSSTVAEMLHRFTDECAQAVWERDGLVNKFIGDAMLAIFNFPIEQGDHVEQAVRAAQDMQRRWARRSADLAAEGTVTTGLGIGIHTGMATIGEIGTAYKDFTVIGPVVNMASRIQGAARAGEILASDEVYQRVSGAFPDAPAREEHVKGIEGAVRMHALPA